MILSDQQIERLAVHHGMITPFEFALRRHNGGTGIISRGLSSYGYDLTLSPADFLLFRRRPGQVVDPKAFKPYHLEAAGLEQGRDGSAWFILPAHAYALGVTAERLVMPANVTGVCLGKSTYARCGIIVNTTPAEAGWEGHLTLEIANTSDADVRIYANEGICQMLFYPGEPCRTTYADRAGKYQDQPERATLARI